MRLALIFLGLLLCSISFAEDRTFICGGVGLDDGTIYVDLNHKLAAYAEGNSFTLAGLRSISFPNPYTAETVVTYDHGNELKIVFNKTRRKAYVVLDLRAGNPGLEAT